MSQTRRLGNSLKDNPFIKRDPRWTPTPSEKDDPFERRASGNLMEQSPTPKARGRSLTPQEQPPPASVLRSKPEEENGNAEQEGMESNTLSAAAPTFSPEPAAPINQPSNASLSNASPAPAPPPPEMESAPPPDVSSIDTFTQTGAAQDDLFDDIVPVDDSMRVRSEDDLFGDDFTPLAQPVVEEPTPAPQPQPQPTRSRGDGQQQTRGRGRGRGRGAQSRGGASTAEQPHISQQNGLLQSQHAPAPNPPEDAPLGPRKETTPSVRGDRRATGGNMKPKLTEAELAEKMARIQIKNASLTAAHARAEADAASFAEREAAAKTKAAQKVKAERKDRQQMMGERERNRMRKLKAMEGREWDAEKEEREFERGGRFDGKGFKGDEEGYTDGREYLYREPKAERRGGGRGGKESQRQDAVPRKEDFPALPAAVAAAAAAQKSGEGVEAAPAAAGTSWADQVESSA